MRGKSGITLHGAVTVSASLAIGIDLGGTYIKGGACDATGRLLHKQSITTEAEQGYKHVLGRMALLVHELRARVGKADSPTVVGVGAPGPMSHSAGMIYKAPNLPGFDHVPLRDDLARQTGLPVTLENDANAAAYGEFVAGAGAAVSSMVMLTLGTGIGGGVVLDGKLWRGAFDNAGEVGHMIIVPGGRDCPCSQAGCLERYASANAVAERLAEAVAAGAASILAPRVHARQDFDARDVLVATESGDALAQRIWEEACLYLALGIVNLQHVLNPQLVVLAGGLINAGDKLLKPVQAHFNRLSWTIAPDHPQISLATLGTDAGTIGAAMLAMQEVAG